MRRTTMLVVSILSDSFPDCLPRGGRILPENPDACFHDLALERMKGKESDMSRRNGDRSSFNCLRRAKLHNWTRIRELRKILRSQESEPEQKVTNRNRHDFIVAVQVGIKRGRTKSTA